MQAGRELDEKVAEALGWVVKGYWVFNRKDETVGRLDETLQFSTTWEGMGVLVEEARKQGIAISLFPYPDHFLSEASDMKTLGMLGEGESDKAPHAACLAFLDAKEHAI